jgi:RecB family exonuclease
MADPVIEQIDELVGPATPHFAYQIRARVRELIESLPDGHPARRYGEEKMELLDRLGHASSKADEGEREPRSRPGWERVPSSAPAYDPLPPRR